MQAIHDILRAIVYASLFIVAAIGFVASLGMACYYSQQAKRQRDEP